MKRLKYVLVLAPLLAALMLVSSCNKEEGVHGPAQNDPVVKGKILDVLKHLPKVSQDRRMRRGGPGNQTRDGGWNFAQPGDGYNYSSSGDVLTYSQNQDVLVLSPSALGTNQTSGGTVVAGETSLNVNYTYCFAADDGDQALGGDLFGFLGTNNSGVSGVVGLEGHFEDLQNADSTTKFGDIFPGLAFYFVYDGKPSGSYDVIDWLNVDWSDSTTYDKMCFAFVFDFKHGRLFLSTSGSINVSGGSMMFSGRYLEVSGWIDDNGDYDVNGDNITYREVDGFGTMGCN